MSNIYENFWKTIDSKSSLTQLQRYENKKSPEYIKKFISLGGGPKMGYTCEKFAKFYFKSLQNRKKGTNETGYDHIVNINN